MPDDDAVVGVAEDDPRVATSSVLSYEYCDDFFEEEGPDATSPGARSSAKASSSVPTVRAALYRCYPRVWWRLLLLLS